MEAKSLAALTLEEKKEMLIKLQKSEAKKKLEETDWYVIRKADTGIEIPQSIIDERIAIRAKVLETETIINAGTGIQEIMQNLSALNTPQS